MRCIVRKPPLRRRPSACVFPKFTYVVTRTNILDVRRVQFRWSDYPLNTKSAQGVEIVSHAERRPIMIVFKDLRQVSRTTLRRDVRGDSSRKSCSMALLNGLLRRVCQRSYGSRRTPKVVIILLCTQKFSLIARLQSLLAGLVRRRGIGHRLIDKCREQKLQCSQERYVTKTTHLTEV